MDRKDARRLVVRRETIRELNPDAGAGPIAATTSATDASNNCCEPTCPTLTARTNGCL